ncbi:MAG: DPP IV N-terminal domain-containing protein [Anaerolineae bacterium]
MTSANTTTLYGYTLKLMGWLAACALILIITVQSFAPTSQQVMFLSSSPSRTGFYTLDIERSLFAPYAHQPVARTFSDFDWSPDRQRIVFRSVRNISIDLFIVDFAGHVPIQLTGNGKNNHAPAWSPDGRMIAFTSERDGNPEIYILPTECFQQSVDCEAELTRITDTPNAEDYPTWSPDSQHIAFQSKRDGNYEIYVVDIKTLHTQRLTHSPGRDIFPAWSPDGQTIAFSSERDNNSELYLMDADGNNQRRLTSTTQHEFTPRWSPEGSQLLYERTVAGGDLETFLIDLASGQVRQLTTASMFLHNPAWLS